jgi:hypothetical protein
MSTIARSHSESDSGESKWHAKNRVVSVVRIRPLNAASSSGEPSPQYSKHTMNSDATKDMHTDDAAASQRPAVIATSTREITYQSQSIQDRSSVRFDLVLPPGSKQQDVYAQLGEPCLQAVQEGCNISIICYGQTGAGKTYTLLGNDGQEVGTAQPSLCIAPVHSLPLSCTTTSPYLHPIPV